ncbi:MAG: ATP-binding protein [Bacteroidia bacterium]|nr:ATP-binding protein [Bacteroidia bacterium]
MGTASKNRRQHTFQYNLLLSIGTTFILFAVCFSIYQYRREKEYKIDIMHSRLQMYNYELAHELGENNMTNKALFDDFVNSHNLNGLRVTIIDTLGNVLLDSYESNLSQLDNHLERAEISRALVDGNGYDIKRTSESTHTTYFYSATRINNVIVRSAVPYSAELTRSLQADNSYLFFALALTILLGFVLYWTTHRISRHIGYLREFAVKAEEGSALDHELERKLPDDELGEISHTIIMLYWKLRHSEEERVRMKRQLTQNAAHELKTPAASIHGYLESILDNPNMDNEQRLHFLQRCFAQSERMNKLLQDMSMLTKLDEMDDKQSPSQQERREISIETIVHNVLDDTALQLQSRNITPKLDICQPSTLIADTYLIYSIFRNLIDNAIAYATGATQIKIVCQAVPNGNKHRYNIVVEDNGSGVSHEHLPHLFERFYRVDKGRSRKMGGTGLGLAIVKNAIAAHGGTVSAESAVNGGLSIRFDLSD